LPTKWWGRKERREIGRAHTSKKYFPESKDVVCKFETKSVGGLEILFFFRYSPEELTGSVPSVPKPKEFSISIPTATSVA
jgi:hypothetical protein